MTTEELYLEFVTKVNERGTYADRYLSPDSFVMLWNTEKDRWLEQSLQKKESTSMLQDLQFLYRDNEPAESLNRITDQYYTFKFPSVHQTAKVRVVARKGDCVRDLRAFPVKHPSAVPELLADPMNEPSFEWEETFYNISEDKLLVYYKGFVVQKAEVSYYRTLNPVDLEGYTKLDGTYSRTINPEPISDIYLKQILDRVILEFYRITPQQDGLQTGMNRVQTEEREGF